MKTIAMILAGAALALTGAAASAETLAEKGEAKLARMLEAQIWGQGFPQPLFCDTFDVEARRVVGERHLKLLLKKEGRRYEAMCFNALENEAASREAQPNRIRAAYRLGVNEFNGMKNVQINVEHFE